MPSPDQALNHEHLVRHSSWGSISVERHDELEKAHATKDTASAIRDFRQINDFSDAFTGSIKVAESLPVYHVRPISTEVREM